MSNQTKYYEARENEYGEWKWVVYTYDETGNREVILHESDYEFESEYEALETCGEFMEDHGIDAELG